MTEKVAADVIAGVGTVPVKIDGQKYDVGEVLYEDLVEYQRLLRKQALDEFTERMDRFDPTAQARIMLALSTGVQAPDQIFNAMMTPDGSMWLMRRVLGRAGHDPDKIKMRVIDVLAATVQVMTYSGLVDPKVVQARMTEALTQVSGG